MVQVGPGSFVIRTFAFHSTPFLHRWPWPSWTFCQARWRLRCSVSRRGFANARLDAPLGRSLPLSLGFVSPFWHAAFCISLFQSVALASCVACVLLDGQRPFGQLGLGSIGHLSLRQPCRVAALHSQPAIVCSAPYHLSGTEFVDRAGLSGFELVSQRLRNH